MYFPDPAVEASEREQQVIEIASANCARPTMQFTGTCYYCEQKVSVGCFCSAKCCEGYQRIERAKRQRIMA